MVEGTDPGQASEAGRLAQKSAEAFDLAAEAAADPGFKETKLEEAQELAGDSALAAAYTHLQQIVGVIAVALPFVLIIGNRALTGDELESSISAYYHTPMGGVFVGALCALAVFFLSYNYKPLPGFNLDNKLSTLATIAALGVAFFPTTGVAPTQSEQVVGRVHLTFAGLLFTLLAVFALFLFPRSGGAKTAAKRHRNIVYRTCGVIIIVAMVLVPVSNWRDPPEWLHAFFWLETICVVAFGVSWLVKGGFLGILADKKPTPAPAPAAP
jgi:uncharacterized membrane protein YiaA